MTKANLTDSLENLSDLLQNSKASGFYASLELGDNENDLAKLKQRIESPRFEIAVIGEFSTGKSTFINALLEEELLPAAYRPTTHQLMRIEHDPNLRTLQVEIETTESEVLDLSQQQIKKLAAETNETLLIKTALPFPANRFVIYDTPGVNDSAALSESIIFDLLGKVDVIVFMLRADSALKETERLFLEKLVLKKDLDKFFFLINFADIPGPHEIEEVRNYVVTQLGHSLEWPIKELEQRIFIYSAKTVLQQRLRHTTSNLSGSIDFDVIHNRVFEAIHEFSLERFDNLVADLANQAIAEIVKSIDGKLSAAIEHAEGKDQDYAEALLKINAEINEFKLEIHAKELAFRNEMRQKKHALIAQIEAAFTEIKDEIHALLMAEAVSQVGDALWVQKHLRKKIEDRLNPLLEQNLLDMIGTCEDFDKQILPSLNKTIDKIEGIRKTFDFAPILAATGLATGGYAVMSALFPWVIGAAGTALIGGTVLSLIPGAGIAIGGALAAGATGMLNLMTGGSDLAMRAYRQMRDKIRGWVDDTDKQRYWDELNIKIVDIEYALIQHIDQALDTDKIGDTLIEQHFPLKQEIIAKQKQQINQDRQALAEHIVEMKQLRQDLIDIIRPKSLEKG
ncbi:dynamin family protein [Methylotuvimicrobium sp. KM1]|uniref:dynamin family protein n=1 Tax=Methylotuvimicrobium sp. KM1 TaxID=3377707 RepID=UPI0038513F06